MPVLITFLILNVIGSLFARQPDIDINRIKLISRDRFGRNSPNNYHKRRSIISINKYNNNNDHDNNRSGYTQLQTSLPLQYNTEATAETKTPIKVHKPRENPQLFYQSDTYIKEVDRKNINREVSYVYPGREVVRFGVDNHMALPIRHYRQQLTENNKDYNICIKCPQDRTLIAKIETDRVMLQYPRLRTCSGRIASRYAHFKHLYGPKFGNLLEQGSYVIVGQIIHRDQVLQTCKMQVHVLMQFCHIPKYLLSHCHGEQNNTCSFTCRDPKKKLQGQSTLTCGDNMKWTSNLPVCEVPTWCEPSSPPEHGHITCTGSTVLNGFGLAEGSKCHVKCDKGWKWRIRNFSICRRGAWTHKLECRAKK